MTEIDTADADERPESGDAWWYDASNRVLTVFVDDRPTDERMTILRG